MLHSTNMSIGDAHTLGEAIAKHATLKGALQDFQDKRLALTSKQASPPFLPQLRNHGLPQLRDCNLIGRQSQSSHFEV